MKFSREEESLLKEYEEGRIKTRKPTEEELAAIARTAYKTLRKDHKITIRLYEHDYKGIQSRAFEMGMPYQTLISSLIHRYIEGELVERK